MNMHDFYHNFPILTQLDPDPGATATTGREGALIDLAGHDGVIGICPVATSKAASGVLTLSFQQAETSTGTPVDHHSIAAAAGEGGKALVLDIVRPPKRWGRFRVVTSGNGASPNGGVIAIPYSPSVRPVAQSTAHVIDTSVSVVEPSST